MSKTTPSITIVGLGLVGGSIGLALRQSELTSTIIGHDKNPEVSKQAKKREAVDKTDWNLVSACEESDLIVLAIPVGGIQDTLKAIAPYLQPGCVIVDTASLKAPVMAWADEILPDHAHFVGLDPIIAEPPGGSVGLDAARADLFRDRLFCMVPSAKADPEVVQVASNLVAVLGGKPLFMDAAEHDGLMGAVDHLPPVMALALLDSVIRQPSWRELRKVAGGAFETGTYLSSNDPDAYAGLFATNRDNIVRWIDTLVDSLGSLRQSIINEDAKALADRLEPLMEERNRWLADRSQGQWEVDRTAAMPPKPNLLVDTFLGGLWRNRQKKDS